METIIIIVAVVAILAPLISIYVFLRARDQWALLSERCWDGHTIKLILSNGLEEILRKERCTGREFKDVKVVGIAFPGAKKYLPVPYVRPRNLYGKAQPPFNFAII